MYIVHCKCTISCSKSKCKIQCKEYVSWWTLVLLVFNVCLHLYILPVMWINAKSSNREGRQTLLSKSVKVLSHPDFAVSVVFRLRCHSTDQHPHPKKVDPRPDCSSLYHILSAKKPEKAGIFKRSFLIQTLSWEYYMALVASKFPIKATWRSVWFLSKMTSLYLQKKNCPLFCIHGKLLLFSLLGWLVLEVFMAEPGLFSPLWHLVWSLERTPLQTLLRNNGRCWGAWECPNLPVGWMNQFPP